MGMFDTFHVPHRGRDLAVQTKHFANVLNDYRLGDFVLFDADPPRGVNAYIEDHKEDWRDQGCALEWVVLLLVDGCYLDAFVSQDKADAEAVAETMVKLWQAPERQAQAFALHARAHHAARERQTGALDRLVSLLGDYNDGQSNQDNPQPPARFPFPPRHDFDQESWDAAIAHLLLDLPEYRDAVPEHYAVAMQLRQTNQIRK